MIALHLCLSFTEVKVCACTRGLTCHHTYQISSSVRCQQESCLPLCTEGKPHVILRSFVSHICHQALDQSSLSLLLCIPSSPPGRGGGHPTQQPQVVSQEEAKEAEGKWGPSHAEAPALDHESWFFKHCYEEGPKVSY